jgi:hypothetical protein
MRLSHASALAASLLVGQAMSAQAIDWQRIVNLSPQTLSPEKLSATERHDVEAAIVASNTVWDDCEDDNEWPSKLEVHRVNLGAGHYSLVEAGPGCARSGQGANGAMWIVRWDGSKPVVLSDLDGSFRAALPQVSHGLHDVAVVWHNSAFDYGLTLYRYNGTKYRLVDGTDVHCDEDASQCRAVPGVQRATGRAR